MTHAHYDCTYNFFFQLQGRKRFTLYPPSDHLYLYPCLHPVSILMAIIILCMYVRIIACGRTLFQSGHIFSFGIIIIMYKYVGGPLYMYVIPKEGCCLCSQRFPGILPNYIITIAMCIQYLVQLFNKHDLCTVYTLLSHIM